MAFVTRPGNYVKFLRGTPAAWESIETKDADTLYFIAEENATRGTLYLGNKLISSGITNTYSLSDLEDVLIGANVPSDAVLVYNDTDDIWEPVSLETAIATVIGVMRGATAEDDGLSGLVPQPTAGQQGLFLRGDGTWANPTAQLAQQMENRFSDLYGQDQSGQSIRDIASSLISDLVGDAPDTLDTLEELAAWVQNHEEVLDITQAAIDIDNLSNSMFGTLENPSESVSDLVQMVQEDGVIRILSNLNTIILGNEQTTGLQTRVNSLTNQVSDNTDAITDLNTAMTAAGTRMTTIETNLTAVADRLRWVDVVQE